MEHDCALKWILNISVRYSYLLKFTLRPCLLRREDLHLKRAPKTLNKTGAFHITESSLVMRESSAVEVFVLVRFGRRRLTVCY